MKRQRKRIGKSQSGVEAACVIGVDVGNTNQTAALADKNGKILRQIRVKVDAKGGGAAGVESVQSLIVSLLEEAKALKREVERIGIGFGGPVDCKRGVVLLSHQVHGWENKPLKRILEKKFGIPVIIDNDCNAAALGEWRFGAGRGKTDLVYVNIGTGIGGGVIANSQLVRGVKNGAGEIGHMVVDPSGPICTCGKRGCLEAWCSGPYIALRARERVKSSRARTVLTRECSSEDVFAAATRGDSLAQEIVLETAEQLAHAIGNVVSLLNPQLVILGGGVSEAGNLLLKPIRKSVPRYCLPLYGSATKMMTAQLGYNAGVRGAVALALEKKASE